jgi:hypothetical protein
MLAEVRVKLPEVDPEGTVTDDGTDNAELLLDKLTTNPPDAAALFRVTVHVVDCPDRTIAGEQLIVERRTGATALKVKVFETPERVAVKIAV